jgi:hypothetical protein
MAASFTNTTRLANTSLLRRVFVVDDLKRIAPRLGFSGYQPLMRAYIG